MFDAVQQFRVALAESGITPPPEIIADGRLHRFSPTGKRGDDAGWYVAHGDGIPAGAFGDWRTGASHTWRADIGRRLTPQELAEQQRRIDEARRQDEEERRRRAEQAAALAAAVWKAARPAGSDHPYLARKGVTPSVTLRELDAAELARRVGYSPQARDEALQGRVLLVPVRVEGKLATLEFIDAEGRKPALAGGTKKGGYWATGPLPDKGRVVLAEGVATALSIAQALGEPVAAALSVGNLQAAGEAIRAAKPGIELVIAADLDKTTGKPHPEAVKAAEALQCRLAIPDFGPDRKPGGTDFNDLHAALGLDAVRRCFEIAEMPPDVPDAADIIDLAEKRLAPDVGDKMPFYPVDALGPLSEVARAIAQGKQAPQAIAGQSVLITAALLTSGLVDVETIDGDRCPLALYGLIVAPSGSGKDAADSVVIQAVRAWQRDANRHYAEEIARYEAAAKTRKKEEPPPAKPIAPHRLSQDITIEGLRRAFADGVSAQGVFSTEAAAVLAGYGFSSDHRAKTAAALCGLWDRGHLSVLRAGTGRFEAYGLRLSVNLAIQPAAVFEPLHDPLLANIGLWPRFLLAWPPMPAPRKAAVWRPDGDPAVVAFWERCRELIKLLLPKDSTDNSVLLLSDPARRVLGSFFEEMEHASARGGDLAEVRTLALRAAEQATRIAGVLAAWDRRDRVSGKDAEHGITLARYSVECWLRALSRREDRETGRAMELLRWVLERPGRSASLSDILRTGPRSLRSASARDAAIARLADAGLIQKDGATVSARNSPHPTPAKVAKAAKTPVTQGFRAGEAVAKTGEDPASEAADSPSFRHFSPSVRQAETPVPCGFSPNSPDSPREGRGNFQAAAAFGVGVADGDEVDVL